MHPSISKGYFLSKKPVELIFGTSGLRELVEDMTDLECYINVRGYIGWLKQTAPKHGGIKGQKSPAVCIAGDLRSSTDRIMKAVAKAIQDSDCRTNNCGNIPAPAVAHYAMQNGCASIMVTGSHIPDDRNGIKPNKANGEVLKSDEPCIKEFIAKVREQEYAKLGTDKSLFDKEAMFKISPNLPEVDKKAGRFYIGRYLKVFPHDSLKGKRIVLYQHSAVGRDIIAEMLKGLGAEVIIKGRSDDKFIPVDTEAIRKEDIGLTEKWAKRYKPFAVLSIDGDSDRPWLSDENGKFLRGDMLGVLGALYLDADFAAVPVSSNDAIDIVLGDKLTLVKTRIGSPYVIKAMLDAVKKGFKKVVSWEVNGGFLAQTDFNISGKTLKALPTRDAALPLICALLLAIKEGKSLAELIAALPKRFTHADRIKFKMDMEKFGNISKAIIKNLSPKDENIEHAHFDDKITIIYKDGSKKVVGKTNHLAEELVRKKEGLERKYFTPQGFERITTMIFTDGVRIIFKNNDVIHFRPSGNATEFRCYSNADTQERANDIVRISLGCILPKMGNIKRS